MRSPWPWLILLALLLIVSPLSAQDAAQPLLDMLALIPDTPSARESIVSYVDFRAVETARPGALQPESWAEWDAAYGAESSAYGLWFAALMGVSSGPPTLLTTLLQAGTWPEMLGFDFFDVDRAIEYNQPPGMVQILNGDFDAEAITNAYEARDFSAEARGDLTLLCGSAGCDHGLELNPDQRDSANPFGGTLGRQEPLLIAPGYLVNSPAIEQIERHIALLAGETPALADDPGFRAAAEAAAREGLLIQAQLVDPALFGAEGEATEAIPPYDLLLVADAATADEQVVTIGLVYTTAEDAQTAADALPGRIEGYTSLATNQPLTDLLAARDATYAVEIYEADEATLALVVLRAPLAGPDEVDGSLVSSSLVYRLIIQMLYQRDLGWITP
ncbi:MAG: hypothetical protein IT320_09690 [Anaerolineae bacterium]|nr:hypothetical protein [Anaerolineae bacterium]